MNAQPRPLVIAGVFIICVLIIGLLLAYLPLPEGIRSWLNVVFAPQEVRSHAYLGVEDGKGVVYEVGATGIKTHAFDGYSVIDYLRTKAGEFVVLKDGTGAHEIYALSGSERTALTSDGRIKKGMTVSSDGTYMAYAVKARTAPLPSGAPEGATLYSLSEWDVEVVHLPTGEQVLVGAGNHPHFYKDGLFYLSPEGFTYRTPGENGFDARDSRSILAGESVYRIMRIADFTDEGVFIFPSVATLVYEELRLESVKPLAFTPKTKTEPKLPPETLDMQVLAEDAKLVLIQVDGNRVGLFKMKGENMQPLFTFPSAYKPVRFLDVE